MNDFLLVFGIASITALLTFLGVPLAELVDVPAHVISAALQFAAGVLSAIVALTLMPPAVENGPALFIVLAFFVGGSLFVALEYILMQRQAPEAKTGSLALHIGVLVDMVIDGALIGIGSTLTIRTGLVLALGIAVSTMPLAFVSTATAKRQGMPPKQRRLLSLLFVVAILAGAVVGYGVLRNQPIDIRLVLIALASGFLITTITQSMIPEAHRDGKPIAGIFFLGGLTLYALLTLAL